MRKGERWRGGNEGGSGRIEKGEVECKGEVKEWKNEEESGERWRRWND